MPKLRLLPQIQLVDYLLVALAFRAVEVIEQAAALRDHLQKAAPRRMVLRVGLKVFGQLRDPFRQQRDLDVSAARVLLMQLELLEIRRVLSHKRGRYCRLSSPNRKLPPQPARSSLMAFANY
jgi:hypothetical protein